MEPVVDAVAIYGGQLLGESVGNGDGKGVGQVGRGELACRHGLIVFEHGGRGVHESDIACSGVTVVPPMV